MWKNKYFSSAYNIHIYIFIYSFVIIFSTEKMSETFVKRFSQLLKNGQGKEAVELFTMEDPEAISDSLSKLVSIAAQYLTESNLQCDEELYQCCKTILNTIAKMCNPMETVLEFLEQIECLKDDIKFLTMLEPLGICLLKMIHTGKTIDWCLNTIKSYIENLPAVNDDDQEATDNRNVNVHREVVLFLEPLIHKTVKINSKFENGSLLGDSLLSFLISLHDRPFCMISTVTVKKKAYNELLEKIMALISCLTGDTLYFLDIVSRRYRNIIHDKPQNINSHTESYKRNVLFESSRNISNMAYANFYFHVITKEKYWKNVPQVYNLYYILEKSIYLIYTLLHFDGEILIWNGLIFMENVIKRISHGSLSSEMLELTIYLDIFKPIINVMIYCTDSDGRKKALDIFREYIKLFNMEARYSILLHLYEVAEHSGVLSLITSIFKFSIIECLDSTSQNHQLLRKNMELILKKTCNLPHGSSSDLVEISDEIISTLNLLRFLFIRDKRNETGIWNMVDAIENNYLKPLEQGVHMSKGHWKVKITDLEEQKKYCTYKRDYEQMKKDDANVTLTVGGEQLPVMPIPDKISFCHRVLNGLDVMESILIRVNECISIGKASH